MGIGDRHTEMGQNEYTINVGGRLMELGSPVVMGIINVTPDSFHVSIDPSSADAESLVAVEVRRMLADGARMIDVGGCSTRPGSEPVGADEEWGRLDMALRVIRRISSEVVVSVDTFRPLIAGRCIDEYGTDIINDVSGGCDDMYDLVSRKGVPYILTFNETRRNGMTVCQQALMFFSKHIQQLRDRGQHDIILDPGFGFNKTLSENFELLHSLDEFHVFGLPLLVGVSHKRMAYQPLGITHDQAANGTTVLNTIALTNGADILRVHDVRNAAECIKLWNKTYRDVSEDRKRRAAACNKSTTTDNE